MTFLEIMAAFAAQRRRSVVEIKAAVRQRDGHRCTSCGLSNADHVRLFGKQLDVHRKTPGSDYALDDTCISLCRRCHGPQPKRAPGDPEVQRERPGGAVRIPSDLVEMARFMAFHSKEVGGKRLRLSQVVESVLRAPLTRTYEDFKAALETAQRSKGKKGGGKP